MTRDVSIVVPARNEASNIARLIDAIGRQKTARSVEIIVIDSGSDDGTPDIARKMGATVRSIRPEEFDHGRTRNLGLSMATGKYLVTVVADALPADEHWLEALIEPLASDPTVGGAYSRQLPPPDAHPLEASRILERFTAREEPIVHSWPGDEAWRSMPPVERMYLVNFDDVSAVRRRDAWEKIPISENYWGEDLDWSMKALEAGYKIAFAPRSVVLHAHRPALAHSFRRAYVDQAVVKRMFGEVYYSNASELRNGAWRLIVQDDAAIRSSSLSAREKLRWRLLNPVRRILEALGSYLSSQDAEKIAVTRFDLFDSIRPLKKQGDVHRTSFAIGGVKRNVVFAHPPSRIAWTMRIPSGAALSFLPAIKPEVWGKAGAVRFSATLNGQSIYSEEIDPTSNAAHRSWMPRSIDLSRWFGKSVKIELTTSAPITDNAWAGWGEPIVVAERPSALAAIEAFALTRLRNKIYGKPFRHP